MPEEWSLATFPFDRQPGSFVQDHWTLCQAGWGAAMRTPNSSTDNDTSSLPPPALVSGHQDFDFCVKSLSF